MTVREFQPLQEGERFPDSDEIYTQSVDELDLGRVIDAVNPKTSQVMVNTSHPGLTVGAVGPYHPK